MAESGYSQDNIAYIRTHVDNIERMMKFQVSSNPDNKERIREVLAGRARAAEFYLLLLEGPQDQRTIAQRLEVSAATVSKIGTHLLRAGIVEKAPAPGNSSFEYRTTEFETLLGVSAIARKLI